MDSILLQGKTLWEENTMLSVVVYDKRIIGKLCVAGRRNPHMPWWLKSLWSDLKKILLIQKEGLCSFYGHMSQRLYRTFLLKFVNSLSSLVCRCRPIQFLQARVLRSGELFGTRASCLLLGSWITIANREHFKLRYPSLLRSSKEQKCKYIIHVYKHPII